MASTDKAREALELLESGVATFTTSDEWKSALEWASKFHDYSFGNVMLIMFQRPSASRVAGFKKWIELGRCVRKGEKGITILAPNTRFVEDEATGEKRRVLTGFRAATVFDIEQTDGDPIPDAAPVLLEGVVDADLFARAAAIVADLGFTLERGDCNGANGVTNYAARTIRVRDDVSDRQAFKTLVHEIAHAKMHEGSTVACRGTVEVEAESVAFVVSNALGIATGDYSFPYVAHWSNGNAEEIRKVGARVLDVAKEILAALAG